MASFFRFYQKSFDKRPVITLICANASLNALGDLVAQGSQITLANRDPYNVERPKPRYDYLRTLRFVVFGGIMGPIIGRWAQFLEYRFPLRAVTGGKASISALFKRVVSDQLVMSPIGLVIFLGAMGVMERRTADEIKQKYKHLLMPALVANWSVWPFAQLINYRYMPLAYRVPFQSTCGVFWTLYLSLLNSSDNKTVDRQEMLEKIEARPSPVYPSRVRHSEEEVMHTWEQNRDRLRQH